MAVSKTYYRRWYGLDSEKDDVPGYVRNFDTYFSTDNFSYYVRYDDAWKLVSGGSQGPAGSSGTSGQDGDFVIGAPGSSGTSGT